MARPKGSLISKVEIGSLPKKTRQGCSQNTNLSATSRNSRKKRYRGQGK